MTEAEVSIEQVKRDISNLVNRVAFGNERIILTSRGKPKAVVISLADYDRLKHLSPTSGLNQWQSWLAENQQLAADISTRREAEPLDLENLWHETHRDLEERDDHLKKVMFG